MERPRMPQAVINAIERRQICSRCQYALQGLGESGRCPECGTEFGPDKIVLWGLTANARLRSPALSMAAGSLLMVASLLGVSGLPGPGKLFMLVTWLPFGALIFHHGWRTRNGWQVRISQAGYGCRAGYGNLRLRPWTGDEEVDLQRTSTSEYQFTVRRNLAIPVRVQLKINDEEAEALKNRLTLLLGRHICLEK